MLLRKVEKRKRRFLNADIQVSEWLAQDVSVNLIWGEKAQCFLLLLNNVKLLLRITPAVTCVSMFANIKRQTV